MYGLWTFLVATTVGIDVYADNDRVAALIAEALANNPSVRAAESSYLAAVEGVSAADALPDPTLTFTQALRSVETRVGPQYNVLTLSQRFPWFGKRELSGRAAAHRAEAEQASYAAAERELALRVKSAYYALAFHDRALAIAADERALLERYESLARERYASGRGFQHGVLKLQTALAEIENRIDALSLQRSTAAFRLNALLNRSVDVTVEETALAEPLSPAVDVEALLALGEENRPELQSASAQVAASATRIELVQKSPWPDLVVGFGFINTGKRGDAAGVAMPPPDNGKNAVNVSVGLSLPLFRGKYDESLREASERQSVERHREVAIVKEMELSVHAEASQIETLRRQMELFDTVLLPQADATLRATELAYESAQLPVLELLDSERALLELRLMRAGLDRDYRQAMARLERAIGTRFPR